MKLNNLGAAELRAWGSAGFGFPHRSIVGSIATDEHRCTQIEEPLLASALVLAIPRQRVFDGALSRDSSFRMTSRSDVSGDAESCVISQNMTPPSFLS